MRKPPPPAVDDIAPMGDTLCNVLRKIGSLRWVSTMIDVSVLSPRGQEEHVARGTTTSCHHSIREKATGVIKAVMWTPGGRDVGKKQGHLPLGTLLLLLVILGKLKAGIMRVCVCMRGPTTKPREEDHRCNQGRTREPSGNVRRGGSSWVGSEREERATELRVSRRTHVHTAPGRRRETLKLGGGTSGWGGEHAR